MPVTWAIHSRALGWSWECSFQPVHHSRPLQDLWYEGPCGNWGGIFGVGADQNMATRFLWKPHRLVWIFLSMDPASGYKSGQAHVRPVALELLWSSQQSSVRAPPVVLCLVTARLFWSRFYWLIWVPAVRGSKPAGAAEATLLGCPGIQLHASPCYAVKHLDYRRDLVRSHFLSTGAFWDTFLPLSSPQKVAGIFCSS